MNKYQQRLNDFREQLKKNNEKQVNLKKKKENKKYEITKLKLQNYEIEKKLLEFTIMKKKFIKCLSNQQNIKKKYLKFTYSVIALEMFFLLFFPSLATGILTASTISIVVLLSSSFTIASHKINKLDLKIYDVTRGLTKEEISKNIESLLFQKEVRNIAIEEIKSCINNIDKKIEDLEGEIYNIYDNYLIVLDTYQESLAKIDSSIDDNTLEEKINEDYNANESKLLQKINQNKCD